MSEIPTESKEKSEDKEIKISMEDGYVIGNFVPIEKGGNCHGQEGKL